MPMYLIPLNSKVEALAEILDVRANKNQQKLILRLADGLLLLIKWRYPPTCEGWDEMSKDGQDSFLFYGFLSACVDGDHSETSEIIFTYSSSRQITMWSASDGVLYRTAEMDIEYPITAATNSSSGRYILCSFSHGVLIVANPSTLSIIRRHNLEHWIIKMRLLKKLSQVIDQFVAITSINEIIIYQLDHNDLSWVMKSRTVPIDPRGCGVQVSIETCEADDSLFAACFDDIIALYQVTPTHLVCLERLSVTGTYITVMKFYGSDYVAASTPQSLNIIKVPKDKYPKHEENNGGEPNLIYFDFVEQSFITDIFSITRNTMRDMSCGSFDFTFINTEKCTYSLISVRIAGATSNKIFFDSCVEKFILNKNDESLETYSSEKAFNILDELTFNLWYPFGLEEYGLTPCFAIITTNDKLILSYPHGIMLCMSLEQVATQFIGDRTPSKIKVLSAPDLGKVVAMHCTTTNDQTILFTGNNRGTIHIWCMEKFKLTNTFHVHSEAVLCFLLIPSENSIRAKSLLVSISSDNLVAVFSLNPISCLYTLTGHDTRISKLHWHESEELLAIETILGSISIWQLRTGYLDRKLNAREARDIIHQFNWSTSCKYLMSHKPSSGGVFSVEIIKGNTTADYIFIFLVIDTIKLAYAIYAQHVEKKKCEESHNNEPITQACQWDLGLCLNIDITRSVLSELLEMSENSPITLLFQNSIPGFPTTKNVPKCMKLFYSIEEFKIEASFILYSPNRSSEWIWTTSPRLTSAKILEIVLIKCTLGITDGKVIPENLSEKIAVLLSRINNLVGSKFSPPSIEYLAKYWFGPLGEPQTTIKHVFKGTLYSKSPRVLNFIIARNFSNLPIVSGVISEMSLNAVLLLSIIARVNVKLLEDAKPIARSLVSLAGRSNTRTYRILSIELLGYDSSVWTKFIDGHIIFDVLFSISGLKDESYMSAFRGMPSGIITGDQYSKTDNIVNSPSTLNSNINIQTQFSPAVSTKVSKWDSSSNPRLGDNILDVPSNRRELFPAFSLFHLHTQENLREIALASLVYFSSVNSNLFANILFENISNSLDPLVSAGGFRLLGILLHKMPLVLYRHIPQLVNVMVKSMDPNQVNTNSIVRKIIAANLSEITVLFPNVAFSLATQRLMVGVQDGSLVIYDVRTATRVQVIEAHLMPVTAAAFSPDGKLVVSYSLEENVVRFWQATGGGFFNSLIGALGPNLSYSNHNVSNQNGDSAGFGSAQSTSSVMVGQMKLFRAFILGKRQETIPSLSDIVHMTKFSWTSNRSVMLTGPEKFELSFNV